MEDKFHVIVNPENYWLKNLDTELNEPTNQNLISIATKKKTFGTR